MIKSKLRTPLTYYGGKQNLAAKIVSLIPEHNLYCEPFTGGAAIFFAKEPSSCEVLNDTNRELMNFYSVCKNQLNELQTLVNVTLHSRSAHDDAWVIYNKPHLFSEVRRAWAVWVLSSQSFSAKLDGSWGYDKSTGTTSLKIVNKKSQFTEQLALRLQNVQIESTDALYVIQSRDTPNSFFYIDPPYHNSNCGHYRGYTEDDFEALLKLIGKVDGKFLLSSYPSPVLERYVKLNGWHQLTIEQTVSVNAKSGNQKKKVEVLTANYPLN